MFKIHDEGLVIEVDSLQELLAYRAARRVGPDKAARIRQMFASGLEKVFTDQYREQIDAYPPFVGSKTGRKHKQTKAERAAKRRAYQMKWRAKNKKKIAVYNRMRHGKQK